MDSLWTELIFSHEASFVIRRGDAGILTQPCFCLCTVCNYLFKNEYSANPLIPDILALGWSNKQIKSYLHITNEFWKQPEIIPSESPVPAGMERDSGIPMFSVCQPHGHFVLDIPGLEFLPVTLSERRTSAGTASSRRSYPPGRGQKKCAAAACWLGQILYIEKTKKRN